MNIRITAAGLTAAVALFCSVPTEAAIINGSDFNDGASNQLIQGITITASGGGGTFKKKTVGTPAFTGVGVSGGSTGDEIDIGESITGTASSFNIGSITIGFLFDGPEFGDFNEVAKITVDGNAFLLTAIFDGLVSWTGPGTVTNLSPATPTGAAVWLLSGLNFTDVQTVSFTALTGKCGQPNPATCTNQSDFGLVQLDTSVPEPSTIGLIGLGLLGLGAMRRRRRYS